MKKILSGTNLLIGFVFALCLVLIFFLFVNDSEKYANIIRIIAALINASVLVFIAVYVTKSQHNTRALKDYFISDLNKFSTEYWDFLNEIDDKKYTKREVILKNKEFSMLSNQFTHIVKREMKIETNYQSIVHKIYNIIAGNYDRLYVDRTSYFDLIDNNDIIELTNQQKFLIAKHKKDLNLLLKNVVINITKF